MYCINKNKRIFCCLIGFILIFQIMSYATDKVKEMPIYGGGGFSNSELSERLGDALVFRVNNSEAYAFGERYDLDIDYENLKTYDGEGGIYIPLMFSLTKLGIKAEEYDGEIKFNYLDKDYTINEGEAFFGHTLEISQHRLCISARGLSEILEKQYFEKDGIVIISETENVFDLKSSKDLLLFEEIKNLTAYEWGFMTMGPLGFVTGVYVHPNDPELMYARTDVGGLYKWSKLTKRWIQLGAMFGIADNTQSFSGVMSIGLDPFDFDTIYAAVGVSSKRYTDPTLHDVLKSTDGGRTWKKTNLNKFIYSNGAARLWGESLMVDPKNSNIVYCGTRSSGLWVSMDGCESWKLVSDIPTGETDDDSGGICTILFDSSSEIIDGRTSVIYVGVPGSGVWQSLDGGKSFAPTGGGPIYPKRLKLDGGTLYATGGHMISKRAGLTRGFFKYEKGAWSNLTPSIAENKNFNAFVISPDDPNVIVIFQQPFTTVTKYHYRTRDGGKTWENMGIIRQISDAVINPLNSREIMYGWGFGIQVIGNILAPQFSIRDMDDGIEELVTNQILSVKNGTKYKTIAAVWDMNFTMMPSMHDRESAIYNDAGGTIAVGYDVEQCEAEPKFIVRSGTKEGDDGPTSVQFSEDYGVSWKSYSSWNNSAGANNLAVSATVQENGYPIVLASSTNSLARGIFRTKDFGETWEKLDITVNFPNYFVNHEGQFLESDKVDGKTFYFMDPGQNFYRTTDGGDSWNVMSGVAFTNSQNYSIFSMPSLHAAYGREGFLTISCRNGFYVSEDGGTKFTRNNDFNEVAGSCFGVHKPGSTIPALYVFGDYKGIFGVYRSDDLGKSWVRINDDSNPPPTRIHSMEGDRSVYGRIFIATDGAGAFYGQPIEVDDDLPKITPLIASSTEIMDADYAVRDKNIVITGEISKKAEVRVNNIPQNLNSRYRFNAPIELSEGMNKIRIEAIDKNRMGAEPLELNIRYIPNYTGITFDFDITKSTIAKSSTTVISGRLNTPGRVFINDLSAETDDELRFSQEITLKSGMNEFEIYAESEDGHKSETINHIIDFDLTPPVVTITEMAEVTDKNYVLVKGNISKTGQMRFNGMIFEPGSKNDFIYRVPVVKGENTVYIEARDFIGNVARPQSYKVLCTDDSTGAKERSDISYVEEDGVKLDGVIEENVWLLDKEMNKVVIGSMNNHAKFGILWNEKGLYIAADVIDSVLNNDTSLVFNGDTIEVYIDAENNKGEKYDPNCSQFFFTSDGTFSTPGTKYASVRTEFGYSMEIFIPWSMFTVNIKDGSEIGFDIDVCDNDGGLERNGVAAYYGTADNWKDPSVFATLKLKK